MSLDVSFWEPPNWKKESSISPVFLGLVVLIVTVVVLSFYFGLLIQSENNYKSIISSNKHGNLVIQAKYSSLKKVRAYTSFLNQSIITPLTEQQNKPVFVSALMQEFQKNIPKSIVFDKFSFDAFKSASPKKGKKSGLRYRVILRGYAIGNNSENIVGDFVKQLRMEDQFKEKLISVAIQGRLNKVFTKENSTFKTTFSIDCTFEMGGDK
ncbi:MAG: hypothetical protein KAG98_06695 [Lentisphaeria bacterium]|nr:hypothetical protein [Lentisphaeria bacterium]